MTGILRRQTRGIEIQDIARFGSASGHVAAGTDSSWLSKRACRRAPGGVPWAHWWRTGPVLGENRFGSRGAIEADTIFSCPLGAASVL